MFFREFCQISKNTFFIEHLSWLLLKIGNDLEFPSVRAFKRSVGTQSLNKSSTFSKGHTFIFWTIPILIWNFYLFIKDVIGSIFPGWGILNLWSQRD